MLLGCVEDDFEDRLERSAEVDALVRCHGLQLEEACRLVGLNENDYVFGTDCIDWLPLPSMIYDHAYRLRRQSLGHWI